MKPGDKVTIYEDPITQLKYEGMARLIKKISNLGNNLELWKVKFTEDSLETTRTIKAE